jgi:SAM-dependent methyltransferase
MYDTATAKEREMAATYTIDGGTAGKERLDILARVCAPGTTALLDRVGISAGDRCLDLGCGGGHVTRELAVRAGEKGFVLGIDLDATVLELARQDLKAAGITGVELRRADATDLREGDYDVAYARFLLSHVAEPARLVQSMADALKPGGVAILEDVDFTGYFCEPPSRAHDRWVELYRETVRRRGGNADLGPKLPALLQRAGLERIGVSISQEYALDGDPKLIPALTLERIAVAVSTEGVASAREVAQTISELYALSADPSSLMGMPRVVQAWGTRPSAAPGAS